MTKRIPLSVAIITYNEETNLPKCLDSVDFADEVVIDDSNSTDRTVFLKIYLLKLGILDGLVNAFLKASGSFFKYAKAVEMQRFRGRDGQLTTL